MAEREQRSADQLEKAAGHVCYELTTMLDQVGATDAAMARLAQGDVRAHFEASLLHARNLVEFLTHKPKKLSLMYACDFGSEWRGALADPRFNDLLSIRLTHLRWERVTDPIADWPNIAPLVDDLLRLFEEFVDQTPNGDLFCARLAEAKLDWTNVLARRERIVPRRGRDPYAS